MSSVVKDFNNLTSLPNFQSMAQTVYSMPSANFSSLVCTSVPLVPFRLGVTNMGKKRAEVRLTRKPFTDLQAGELNPSGKVGFKNST